MSFVRLSYNPITAFDQLFEDALTARFHSHPSASAAAARRETSHHRDVYRPRLDLRQSEDTVTATFELPGLTSDNVAIDVHQNCLTISGESVTLGSEEEKGYVIRERCSGKFSRTLQLPFGTTPEDVTAKMENGILTVTFPKTSLEQQAKRVPIQWIADGK